MTNSRPQIIEFELEAIIYSWTELHNPYLPHSSIPLRSSGHFNLCDYF